MSRKALEGKTTWVHAAGLAPLEYSDLKMFFVLGWLTAFISLPSHTHLSFDAYLIINLPVFTRVRCVTDHPLFGLWAPSKLRRSTLNSAPERLLCLNTEAAALPKCCSRLRLLYRHGASLSPYRGNCVGTVIMFYNALTDRRRWISKTSSRAAQLNS